MTSHPSQDRIRENSPGAEHKRTPAPDEEAVLREEVGEVAPGPEGGRMIGSPFASDEGLLDRDAEQDQIEFYEDQSNQRAGDWGPAQSQQTNVHDREDDHLGDGQHADEQEVPGQEERKVRQSVGFILRLK